MKSNSISRPRPAFVHERRSEAARRHIQRYLPPVIDHRLEREPNLADDLEPHVQGVARVAPVGDREIRP